MKTPIVVFFVVGCLSGCGLFDTIEDPSIAAAIETSMLDTSIEEPVADSGADDAEIDSEPDSATEDGTLVETNGSADVIEASSDSNVAMDTAPFDAIDSTNADTTIADTSVDSATAPDTTVADTAAAVDTAPADTCVANGCGGCTALAKPKDTSCGVCGTGYYVCNSSESTRCSDPVTTSAPGTVCGMCGTSKFACAAGGGSTYCEKSDDRINATIDLNSGGSSVVANINPRLALAFKMPATASVRGLRIWVRRTDETTGLIGDFRVTLAKGSMPIDPPSVADTLASKRIAADTLPVSGAFEFVFDTPTSVVAAGTDLYVLMHDESPRYRLEIEGVGGGGSSPVTLWLPAWYSYVGKPNLGVLTVACP